MISYESERSLPSDYVYNQRDVNLTFADHMHTSFEFLCVYEGEIDLTVDGMTYTVSAGRAALILPNRVHSYRTKGFSRSYLCVFSVSYAYNFYLKTREKRALSPVFPFSDQAAVDVLLSQKDEYLLKSVFYKIIYLFNSGADYEERKIPGFDLVEKILLYAENNFRKDVTLKDLAKEFSYSYNYLSGVINGALGMNFNTLINAQRINLAAHLVKDTNATFTEIALNCGYSSIRSFNRNFKNFTGKSPGEYRAGVKTETAPLQF
ncbi:MAG: helix-turn-helix transcriptional regulator [Clostridia bacterium]|nr:helix-turn-helix transcriptional regulator [Clostridia bacterium]